MPSSVYGREVENAFSIARNPARRMVRVDGRDVEITSPFRSPEDWRDQWIYFLLVDRFNNPDAPPAARWDQPFGGFQGGTLEGVRQRLGYLHRLGAGAIWLSPVLQNCQAQAGSYHGYGIQNFLTVDPRFASDKSDPDGELRGLVDEAHARGIYVIMDIVLHHAGDVFAYQVDGSEASAARWSDGGYTVRWRGADDRPVAEWSEAPQSDDVRLTAAAAVWPDEIRCNSNFMRKGRGGEAGGDFESLKGFARPAPPSLRSALIRSYQHAIAKWDVDGFRIDTLKYIEPDFALVFGNAVREYALEIGKKNFFTFGEVYDDEFKIAGFIGRRANDQGDLIGVDAALDFPLFFRLPGVVKGLSAPTEISAVYPLRKSVENGVISSHGDAGRFFVTFLDNHEQHNRFRFVDPRRPGRYDGQVVAGLVSLFSLQGIPCLYYGTEQGLSGNGDADQNVREALWGRPGAFDETDPFFMALRDIATVRAENSALRYGRQYFRPLSGDRKTFGPSTFVPGVLAFSRILNENEIVIIANTDTSSGVELSVLVDAVLNPESSIFITVFSSTGNRQACAVDKLDNVLINNNGISRGTVHAIRVALGPGEAQILARQQQG
jgi:glycosidase